MTIHLTQDQQTQYQSLLADAVNHVTAIVEQTEDRFGENSAQVADVLMDLGRARWAGIRDEDSEMRVQMPSETEVSAGGHLHADTLLSTYLFAEPSLTATRLDKVEAALTRAMADWANTEPDKHRATIFTLLDLAECFEADGRPDRCEALLRLVVDSCKENLEPHDSLAVSAVTDLGVSYQRRGDLREAEALFKEALEACEAKEETMFIYGPRVLMNLAAISTYQHKWIYAESYLQRALHVAERAPNRDEGHVLEILTNLAKVVAAMKRLDEFDAVIERSREVAQTLWESEPELVIPCVLDLIRLCEALDKADVAESIWDESCISQSAMLINQSPKGATLAGIVFEDCKIKGAPRCVLHPRASMDLEDHEETG